MSFFGLDLPVSNEVATGALLALIAFWRELFKFMTLPFTKRERAVAATVEEATELRSTMVTFAQMGKDFGQVVKDFNVERDMYRAREQKQTEEHRAQITALEKTQIETLEQLKDANERIDNLQKIQDELKRDNQLKEKLAEQQEKRIATLEESEKQAHRLVIEKDIKITALEKRVKELEAEITRLKAQQNQHPTSIEATVTIVEAPTDGQPATPPVAPEQGADVVPSQDSEAAQ
jgi:chromosome segregation ATPase